MTTTTTTEPAASKEEQPQVEYGKNRRTGLKLLAIVVVWVGLWLVLRGTQTRELGFQDTTGFHTWLNEIRDWVQLNGPGQLVLRRRARHDRRRLQRGLRNPAEADQHRGDTTAGAGDRLAGRRRHRRLDHLGRRGHPLDDPRHRLDAVLRHLRSLVRKHGPAARHDPFGPRLLRARAADRHHDGPQQDVVDSDHAGARHHADDAAVRLPGPDRPRLRHRSHHRNRADGHLRLPAAGQDHRARHPVGSRDHHRGGPVDGPHQPADAASGPAADGDDARSSSASTRA